MVQYWQILNLDKREALGQEPWGELRDIMLSSMPDALFFQLVRAGANDPHPVADANAKWAGDRIVVISDYALTYPEGMLTQTERDEVEDMYLDSEEGDYEDEDPAPTLYGFAEEWYSAIPLGYVRGEEGAGRVWHLRNLTKKEYVRSDAVAAVCPEKAKERFAPGLGHALVVCGCWTDEVEVFAKEEMGQGSWAGCRVEIRPAGDEPDGWKDVSEQVGRKLAAVWEL